MDKFLLAHPEFLHEPEPYDVLSEDYGEVFAAQPSCDDFYRQLAFNCERLSSYRKGDDVIFERSPVDFLAYMMALRDQGRDPQAGRVVDTSLGLVEEAIQQLDLITFLALDDDFAGMAPAEEDLGLRMFVDVYLNRLLHDNDLGLLKSAGPSVLLAQGSTDQRLQMLERTLLETK